MTNINNEWTYQHSFGVIRSDSPDKKILVFTQRKYYYNEEYGYHFWKLTVEADDIIQRKTAADLKTKFQTNGKIYNGVESDTLLQEVQDLYPNAEIFKNVSNQEEITPLRAPQILLNQIKQFYKDAEFSFSKKGITFSTTSEFNFHIYFGIPRHAPLDTPHNAQLAFLSNYIVEKHFPNGAIRIASPEEYPHAARIIKEHLNTLFNKVPRKTKLHL